MCVCTCVFRADKAGQMLAQVLSQRVHGHRPVTLVGFGMGARVILQCLLHLSCMGEAGMGIVETAVCFGTPYAATPKVWERASTVVSYRYTTQDRVCLQHVERRFLERFSWLFTTMPNMLETDENAETNVHLCSKIHGPDPTLCLTQSCSLYLHSYTRIQTMAVCLYACPHIHPT
jgi:hypothetical protein